MATALRCHYPAAKGNGWPSTSSQTERLRRQSRRPSRIVLFDGEGLALWISPTGVKSWQLRYRLNGKEQTATLGKLDRIPLAEARKRAEELRKVKDEGQAPNPVQAHPEGQQSGRIGDDLCQVLCGMAEAGRPSRRLVRRLRG